MSSGNGATSINVSGQFGAILVDPPWRFANRTGKMAPEHKRLRRYATMSFGEIGELPVGDLAATRSHLYLWCPNALLLEGLQIMRQWGFTYKVLPGSPWVAGESKGFYRMVATGKLCYRSVTVLEDRATLGSDPSTWTPGRGQTARGVRLCHIRLYRLLCPAGGPKR